MDSVDRSTKELVREATPIVQEVLKGLVPDAIIRESDGTVHVHYNAPIIINIGHNAEAMVGDAAIRAHTEAQRRY